jgi:hypothetical protein
VRVRQFWLRLLGTGLTVAWTIAAGLVLLGYRPGGPWDLLVGALAFVPIPIALSGVIWPPTARGERAYTLIVWLGLATALVLIPSIGEAWNQIQARGPQTLLPSIEAGYPWLLALAGTSLYAGLGIARRQLGDRSLRRRRLLFGSAIAFVATATTASLFAVVAIGNDLALRDRPAAFSSYGPTDPNLPLPGCADRIAVGSTARLALDLRGNVDRRAIGEATVAGTRAGDDVRWSASVATTLLFGELGIARIGDRGWQSTGDTWRRVSGATLKDQTLDDNVLATALDAANRRTFEDHGLEFIEGARARHCRVAVDGRSFRSAFPQIAWFVGPADVHRWRGQLDYWVFADDELGQVSGAMNGDAGGLPTPGILGAVDVHLTATFRDTPLVVAPPVQ